MNKEDAVKLIAGKVANIKSQMLEIQTLADEFKIEVALPLLVDAEGGEISYRSKKHYLERSYNTDDFRVAHADNEGYDSIEECIKEDYDGDEAEFNRDALEWYNNIDYGCGWKNWDSSSAYCY